MGMKHPEYDSPFGLTISDITTQMARNIDEMCWQAIQRVGINVDKETLLTALKHDAERYRKAYANGYDTGYEKRDDELVRCKDCKKRGLDDCPVYGWMPDKAFEDWFCGDGKRRDDDDDD